MKETLIRLKDRINDLHRRNRSLRLIRMPNQYVFDLMEIEAVGGAGTLASLLQRMNANQTTIPLLQVSEDTKQEQKVLEKLQTLYRKIHRLEEETGRYDLFIGYPCIRGRLEDGLLVQAPLCLYPIRLERRQANSWYLQRSADHKPFVNRDLYLALQKTQPFYFPEVEIESWPATMKLADWAAWLQEKGISVSYAEEGFQSLSADRQEEIPQHASFYLHPFVVMGIFPQGHSSIVQDYAQLIAQDSLAEEHPLLMYLCDDSTVFPFPSPKDDRSVREQDPFYLLPTDGSQERILERVATTPALVIEGPPGTGRSQVIVNMITDAVAAGKKVLVVCQKSVALNVIYQRLAELGLGSRVALLQDERRDRPRLYNQICSQIDDALQTVSFDEREFVAICRSIEACKQKLNQLWRAMHEKQPFGFTAYQLYTRVKRAKEMKTLIQVSDLAPKFDREKLENVLTHIGQYGEYVERFTRKDYILRQRPSFAYYTQQEMVTWLDRLDDLYERVKQVQSGLKDLADVEITPAYLWSIHGHLAKIYPYLEKEQTSLWQKISLWWWLKWRGKSIFAVCFPEQCPVCLASPEWPKMRQWLQRMYQASEESHQLSRELKWLYQVLPAERVDKLRQAFSKGTFLSPFFSQLRAVLARDFKDLKAMDLLAHQADEQAKELLRRLETKNFSPDQPLSEQWVETVRQSFYLYWIAEMERKHPILEEMSFGEFDRVQKELTTLLKQKERLSRQVLLDRMEQRLQQSKSKHMKAMCDLRAQTGKQNREWTIRKLVETFGNQGLFTLLPVWLTSTEMAATVFPLQKGLFDLVIFEEAVQCRVENALPVIYRGQQVVIVGDEKQVLATDPLQELFSDREEEVEKFEEERSLFQRAKNKFPVERLHYHYRSAAEELIHFSNHAFYEGTLQIVPNLRSSSDSPAIQWHKVEGRWINHCNEVEAQKVIQFVQQQLREQPDVSLGIITFHWQQRDRIEHLLEQRVEEDDEFAVLYEQMMKKERDRRLFVKNIESVQGDVRDVIFLSIGYAPDQNGRVDDRFGSLEGKRGENDLNVAITRAKQKIFVISSIEPDELNVAATGHQGPKLLKEYLAYAKAVAEQKEESQSQILERVNPKARIDQQQVDDRLAFAFEAEVCARLRACGYTVDTQIGISGCCIDLGIVHPHDPSRYLLGIECDGGKERDLYRQQFLEAGGWTILRIWSRDWWQDPERELARIQNQVEEKLRQEKRLASVHYSS